MTSKIDQSQVIPYTLLLRRRAHRILAVNQTINCASRWFDYGLVLLITLNVIAVVASSVEVFNDKHKLALFYFELFSVTIFTIEYIARVWSCVEVPQAQEKSATYVRLRYMLSPMALVDLISIAPFYLAQFAAIDLRMLRIVRLLRVFKLARYSSALNTLLAVLAEEANTLGAAFFVMFITILLAASGIYLLEHDIQPEAFGSIPQAMWWAVATLTTVGYGDVVPLSGLGKLFGGVIIFIGVAMVALPTGIIASGFAATYRQRRMHFEDEVEEALGDGLIDESEQNHLQSIRQELDISEEEAEHIYRVAMDRLRLDGATCPHCNQPAFKAPTTR